MMIPSKEATHSSIWLCQSHLDSKYSHSLIFGFVLGFFGLKIVQQSSYGRIEISKVPIRLAVLMILTLSSTAQGRMIG
jgi:hypothetical protein